jgi:hypothetical protein
VADNKPHDYRYGVGGNSAETAQLLAAARGRVGTTLRLGGPARHAMDTH